MSGWDIVRKAVPVIATALGGPLAGLAVEAVGSALGMSEPTQEKVKAALSGMSPEQMVQMKQIDADLQVRFAKMGYDHVEKLEELNASVEKAQIESVGKAIIAETTAEKWPQYTWRPFIGYAFAINLVFAGVMVGIIYVSAIFLGRTEYLSELPAMLTAFATLNGTALPILGVASWFRGKMQANPEIPPMAKVVKNG